MNLTPKTGTDFFMEIKNYIIDKGYIVNNVPPFTGAVTQVKKPKNFAFYTRDGKNVLIKTFYQRTSGSAMDKIVASYINLSEAPYDETILVLDTRHLNVFTPYLAFFQQKEWTMDKVHVMSQKQFKDYIK